ncbi:MAG: FAD-binding protein, partial [Coriobacteriales bacterium]|nr:FAD-binding protein [Coriobacteriales bacterium]
DLVNALVKQSLHRANARLLSYYYDESGPMFDWLLEGLERDKDYEFLKTARGEPHMDNYFFMKFVPYVEEYDYRDEYYPYFFGSFCTIPDSKWVWDNAVKRSKDGGAEYYFALYVEQLIKDSSGKVVGCYAQDEDGNYYKFNASKAVILACGDIGSNEEMRNYYVPQVSMFGSFYDRFDSKGNLSNTGDGIKMALWAGASMEIGPYAPMTHHAGGALGINAFLQVNRNGERFMNEDIPGQQISNQLVRQPGGFSWQIFDDNWRNELASQPAGHNCINWWLSDEEAEKMPWIWSGPAPDYNITYDKLFFEGRPECMAPAITCYADTLNELADKMEVDAATLKATIDRYNENCEMGEDRDFGKTAKRLYPITKPPFYGMKFTQCEMLVCVAGINCDTNLHAMDAESNIIPGLYVCGNNGGGRFLVEYPVAICGLSLASAAVMGKLAGENAAKGI